MDLASPALTAVFIALVYTVIKVVNYFIGKRNGSNKYGLNKEQEKKLNNIAKELEVISKKIARLDELHSVYDENHVPRWYVPAKLFDTVQKMDTALVMLNKELVDTMDEIKGGQSVLVEKFSDLINSQKLMTERLGDLIVKLNKMSN